METLSGLNCPNCGGRVPVPEGQEIVQCPYCNLRSFVRGERGLRRYQAPQRVQRQQAIEAMQRFFTSQFSIARDVGRKSQLSEAFLVYLPFWTVWGRVGGWVFGQEKVGSGDRARYEPREVRVVQEMTWTGAACDVGEFGVNRIELPQATAKELEPFNPEALHNVGLVFEPVGSFSEARQQAETEFQEQVRRKAGLDRVSQLFVRLFRHRTGLVYYPLWVLRYLYRGRAFQVVVDGYSGKVLYGKAPGSTLYRAAALVGGMALGAFIAIDGASLVVYLSGDDSDNPLGFALFLFAVGLALMYAVYRAFRYGEQVEHRAYGPKRIAGIENPFSMISNITDVEQWIKRLS